MIVEEVVYNIFILFMCLFVIDAVVVGVIKRLVIYVATMFDKIKLDNLNFSDSSFSIAKMKIKR